MKSKIGSLVLALLMIVSSLTSAFAIDLDLFNPETNNRYNFDEFVDSPDVTNDVVENSEDFLIEFEGEYYSVTELQAKIDAGVENFEEAIEGLEPVELEESEDLEVANVSAINPTTITVEFNKDVPAAALEVANFTLSKGTLESVTATGAVAKLNVKGLKYGEVVTVGVVSPAFSKSVTIPEVIEQERYIYCCPHEQKNHYLQFSDLESYVDTFFLAMGIDIQFPLETFHLVLF